MKNNDHFNILYILARPAAGKSEIIQFLQSLPDDERKARFHIGKMFVIDDFPMIWTWFEEDDLLTEMNQPHFYTDTHGYFLKQYFWNLLIKRMNLEYIKFTRDHDMDFADYTVVIEFSRGSEHGGYHDAFMHIPKQMAQIAAILYVNVSWSESLRKNRKRFNPDKPDSILEHSLPHEKLARMYFETDWEQLTNEDKEYVHIGSVTVPYTIFENEDDVTSQDMNVLSARLEKTLQSLWNLYNQESGGKPKSSFL
jgi:hypothetical protein